MSTLAIANTKKREANRMRAEWLASIRLGVLSGSDLIQASTTSQGKPLRRVSLAQILEAEGLGAKRIGRALNHLRTQLGIAPDRRLNVAWLIDARADGRRLQVWADALQERALPWPGFPFTPSPPGVTDPLPIKEGASDVHPE